MERINTTNKDVDLFGAGKHGFKDGDPINGIFATFFAAAWCNAIQEEISNTIENMGIVLDPANRTQLRTAIARAIKVGGADPSTVSNLSVACSVNASALTISTKNQAGAADPSAADPATVSMRDVTLAAGGFNSRLITGAQSLVVPSGATLGHPNAVASPIYVYEIDNAGALEPAASTKYFGDSGIASTTAISAGANSATVMYSTSARANVPFRCVGRLLSTQAAAGTWAAVPTVTQPGGIEILRAALADVIESVTGLFATLSATGEIKSGTTVSGLTGDINSAGKQHLFPLGSGGNNWTFDFTFPGEGCVFTVSTDYGDNCLCIASKGLAAITILGNTSGIFVNSSSDNNNFIGIYKSASSNDIHISNGVSISPNVSVCILGNYASAYTPRHL